MAISVTVGASFHIRRKARLLSLIGIVLFLIGFTLLFQTEDALSYRTLLYLNPVKADYIFSLILFVFFWIVAIKINRADAEYFTGNVTLWLNTLLYSGLVLLISVFLFLKHPSLLWKELSFFGTLPGFATFFLFGVFLWIFIKWFCFLDTAVKHYKRNTLLNSWLFSIIILVVFAFLYNVHTAFLLKFLCITVGIYFFCNLNQTQFFGERMTKRKRCIALFLFSVLFSAVFFFVAYRLSFYSLYISSLIREVLDFLFAESMYENPVTRIIIKSYIRINKSFDFMRKYIFGFGILASCFTFIYLYMQKRRKEKIVFLLNCMFSALISFLAASFLWELYLICIRVPAKHVMWLNEILIAYKEWQLPVIYTLYFFVFCVCFTQAVKRGRRLILWSVFSNYLLYISLSIAFSQLLLMAIRKIDITAFNKVAASYYLINIAVHTIPLLVLLGLVLVYYNKSIEERILPMLLQCRQPDFLERKKISEALALLRNRKALPEGSKIQILLSRITEANAYSIGNKSIAVTDSLFRKLTPQQLSGILSHELGHITNSDGRLRVFLYILNLPAILVRKIFNMFSFQRNPVFTIVGFFCLVPLAYTHTLQLMCVGIGGVIFWFLLQTAIFLMVNQDTQDSELRADEYALTHGLGQELKEALLQMADKEDTETYRESWMEDYPELSERIRRLETMQNPIGA